jgi:hypothetical protein
MFAESAPVGSKIFRTKTDFQDGWVKSFASIAADGTIRVVVVNKNLKWHAPRLFEVDLNEKRGPAYLQVLSSTNGRLDGRIEVRDHDLSTSISFH